MKLQNTISKTIRVPNNIDLFNYITTYFTVDVPDCVFDIFTILVCECDNLLKKNQIDFKNLHKVNAIFTDNLSFSMPNEDIYQNGYTYSIIVYAYGQWVRNRYSLEYMTYIMAHELCHHFWNIGEETVDIKVNELSELVKANSNYISTILKYSR